MSTTGKNQPPASGEIRVNRIREITCPKGHRVDISRAKPLSMIACPNCGVEVRVPAQISHYLLVKLLARGSNGAVYQAYDEKLSRQVALKIIYHLAGDSVTDSTADVLREARTLAAMNHPNIVQVHAFDEDMGQPFIVMELVDGGRLDGLVAGGKTIDERRALRIGADVARGLAAANRLGMTHGDIKPQNILLGRDQSAKLIDFGLSRKFRAAQKDTRIAGTPYYIAPEVVEAHPSDHRADMYSLGATLFQALTGKPPFTGQSPMEVMSARLREPPPDLLSLRPDLSESTAALIHRLLSVDPNDRPPDNTDLAAEFDAALASLPEQPV